MVFWSFLFLTKKKRRDSTTIFLYGAFTYLLTYISYLLTNLLTCLLTSLLTYLLKIQPNPAGLGWTLRLFAKKWTWYLHIDDDTTHLNHTLDDTTSTFFVWLLTHHNNLVWLATHQNVWLGTDQNLPTYIAPKKCMATYVPRIDLYT